MSHETIIASLADQARTAALGAQIASIPPYVLTIVSTAQAAGDAGASAASVAGTAMAIIFQQLDRVSGFEQLALLNEIMTSLIARARSKGIIE